MDEQPSSWITTLGDELTKVFRTAIVAGRELSEEEVGRITDCLISSSIAEFSVRLRGKSADMADDWEGDIQLFEGRNRARWAPAFSAFDRVWYGVAEVSSEFDRHYRPDAAERDDYRFEALSHLNTRSLMVAKECMALMRAGYAEGALARWRTLHELAVTAMFLGNAEQETAFRYLLSLRFQAYRAARQMDEFVGKGTRDSFTDQELAAMAADIDQLKILHEVDLTPEYEWARLGFTRLNMPPSKRINFSDIELETQHENMRPYYRWASQHNHAGHRPASKGLGVSESSTPLMLIGASNSGMIDPLQLSTLSLVKCATVFLGERPTVDTAVYVGILNDFQSEVGRIAQKTAIETRRVADEARRAEEQAAAEARRAEDETP